MEFVELLGREVLPREQSRVVRTGYMVALKIMNWLTGSSVALTVGCMC